MRYSGYYIYNADKMLLGEIEYLIAEWMAKVVCKAGHTYLLIPYEEDDDDEGWLYEYLFI